MAPREPITGRQLRAARAAAQRTKEAYEQLVVDAVKQRAKDGRGGHASVAHDLDTKRQAVQKIVAKVSRRTQP